MKHFLRKLGDGSAPRISRSAAPSFGSPATDLVPQVPRPLVSGFTLIEAILCITILSIMAIVAMPKDTALIPMDMDAAARKIVSDIRYAQNLAMTTSEPHGFEVTGAKTYKIYNVTTGAVATGPYKNTAMNEDLSSSYRNITFSSTAYKVEFDSEGKPSLGGGTVIQIQSGNQTKQLQVTATSGFVSLL